jgi:hypothetical protein
MGDWFSNLGITCNGDALSPGLPDFANLASCYPAINWQLDDEVPWRAYPMIILAN